jgi:hypothetical protein
MAVSYTNRRGEVHYFKAVKTKKGAYRYYVVKKKEGDLLDAIPEQFEIYEHPEEAKVVIRKKIVRKINDDEISAVRNAVQKLSVSDDFMIHTDGNILSVYTGRLHKKEFEDMFSGIKTGDEIALIFNSLQTYIEKMRFVLTDENKRVFTVQRFCYLGRIYDWIDLESSEDLAYLSEKYCCHLGRDSYFDLEPPEWKSI